MAFCGFVFFIIFKLLFKKGPPDAVINIFLIFSLFSFFIKSKIEKCSESTGIKFVLYFFSYLLIKDQPHIIDSLLAIAILLLNFIISKVGVSPSKPLMEDIV